MMIQYASLSMVLGYSWVAIGLLFILAEVGTPGLFYFLSFSVGSFAAAIPAFFGYNVYVQCAVATIVSVLAFFVLKRYFTFLVRAKLKTNTDALLHQPAIVIQTVNVHAIGRVKIKGEEWPAITHEQTSFAPHTVVTVVGIQGNKLIIK